MSTVIEGVLFLEFEDGYAIAETVTAPLVADPTPAERLDAFAFLGLDAVAQVNAIELELLHGPLQSLVWSAQVVPLPGAVWLFLGALAWLACRARHR